MAQFALAQSLVLVVETWVAFVERSFGAIAHAHSIVQVVGLVALQTDVDSRAVRANKAAFAAEWVGDVTVVPKVSDATVFSA